MLFGVVLGLSGFFQTREPGSAVTDDFVFRLFYGATCGLLFLATALVGLQDLVGKNINCYNGNAAVNQYCWVTGTHLLVQSNQHERGLGAHYLGEERCERDHEGVWTTETGEECVKTHSYYQWVPYVLMIMGFLFYLPRLFWVRFEEGKLSAISDGVRAGQARAKDGDKSLDTVARNVADYVNMDGAGHTIYGWAYLAAQILNVLVLLFCIHFTDVFLDGQFLSLGLEWARSGNGDNGVQNDVLYRVFPRLTKCEFQKFGSGGHLQTDEFLCVLAPNIISEKIFIFFWFWFAALLLISVANVALVTLMALRTVAVRRVFMMRAVFSRKLRREALADRAAKRRLENLCFGRFVFLYLLGRNVDYFAYRRILQLVLAPPDEEQDGEKRRQVVVATGAPSVPADRDGAGSPEDIILPSYHRKESVGEMSQSEVEVMDVSNQKTLCNDYPLKRFLSKASEED